MRLPLISTALAALSLCASAASAQPAGPQGRWLSANGNVEVAIAPCGPALCGTIIKVLANHAMDPGSAPMPPRPGLGLKIMTDFRRQGTDRWVGHLYNRENGKTYDCVLSMAAPDQLRLRAYVIAPLIGKTQIWRRMP